MIHQVYVCQVSCLHGGMLRCMRQECCECDDEAQVSAGGLSGRAVMQELRSGTCSAAWAETVVLC